MIPERLKQVGIRFIKLGWMPDGKGRCGKIPAEKDWQNSKNYLFDNPEIISWLGAGNNVGVATGYNMLFVPDIDSREEYERVKDLLPSTFTVKSGGRGLPHYYYFLRDCDTVPNRKVGFVDLKGLGGQVVCAGSVLKDLNGLVVGEYVVLNDVPIASISWNLIKEIFGIFDDRPKLDFKDVLGGVKEGSRNDSLFRLACSLVSQGVSRSDVLALIDAANNRSDSKLSAVELLQIRDSAWKYHKVKQQSVGVVLKLDNYLDNVEHFWIDNPFFYDKNCIFWLWNKNIFCYERTDDTDILNLIDRELGFAGQTITSGIKNNYMEAFRRVGRNHLPALPEKHWVQFRDVIVDVKNNREFPASHEFFMCNPVAWSIGSCEDTPVIDKLFVEWVGDNKDILYEILAYSTLSDYPIHTLFAFIGAGRNGKSRFLELVSRFVGRANCCSTELDNLIDRNFESAKLYKKLVCIMGETNFGTISKTSLLKKLTGQDMIGFEFKNKNPFDDYNYAKIMISSNGLPSSDDTSEGFYRRWLVIHFDNNFPEGKDVLDLIPDVEYHNLARKCVRIIKELLERGSFFNQGTIDERKERYIRASNPLSLFIKENCKLDENSFVKYTELYGAYVQYLIKHRMRIISRKEFSSSLDREGFLVEKTSKKTPSGEWQQGVYVYGLKICLCSIVPVYPIIGIDSISARTNTQKSGIEHNRELNSENNLISGVFSTNETCLVEDIDLNIQDEQQTKFYQQKKDDNIFDFEHLKNILLDKVGMCMETIDAEKLGFPIESIDKWVFEGLLFRVRNSMIKLI